MQYWNENVILRNYLCLFVSLLSHFWLIHLFYLHLLYQLLHLLYQLSSLVAPDVVKITKMFQWMTILSSLQTMKCVKRQFSTPHVTMIVSVRPPFIFRLRNFDKRNPMWCKPFWYIKAETKWPPFPDDILKRIFFNENVWISINISLKCVPSGPINNIPALVQVMAPAIIWTNDGYFTDAYMRHSSSMSYSGHDNCGPFY